MTVSRQLPVGGASWKLQSLRSNDTLQESLAITEHTFLRAMGQVMLN